MAQSKKSDPERLLAVEKRVTQLTELSGLMQKSFQSTADALEKLSGQVEGLVEITRSAVEAFSNLKTAQCLVEKRLHALETVSARSTESLHTVVSALREVERKLFQDKN